MHVMILRCLFPLIWILNTISSEPNIPGLKLEGRYKVLNGKTPFITLETFRLCFFMKILVMPRKEKFENVFLLEDNSTSIKVSFNGKEFTIEENGIKEEFLTSVDLDKWMKICTWRKENKTVNFELNYRTPKKKGWDEHVRVVNSDFNPIKSIIDVRRTGSTATLQFGKRFNKMIYEIAVLEHTSEFDTENYSETDFPCINIQDSITDEEFLTMWEPDLQSSIFYDKNEICRDTYVVVPVPISASYGTHAEYCRNIRGRMINPDELDIFGDSFLKSLLVNSGDTDSNNSNNFLETWIGGGVENAESLDVMCPFNIESENAVSEIGGRSCVIETENNVCLVPSLSDLTLYGPLLKYDKSYFIKQSGNSYIFAGESSSIIENNLGSWVLKSKIHKDEYSLTDSLLPFARKSWTSKKGNTNLLLTLTPCNLTDFSCSSGECVHESKRCNGVLDCLDKSDESECDLIEKNVGYMAERVPPPRANESKFQVQYEIHVHNIADINNEEGIANVDLTLVLMWSDPRLIFWNALDWSKFSCDEIWSPEVVMADGHPSGFQIQFEAYRSSCQVYSVGRHKYSFKDAFMGTYVEPEEMKIALIFSSLVKIPCRFFLRRYPFGSQTCNISIWPDNAYLTSPYEFTYYNQSNSNNMTINYIGRRVLGEYFYKKAIHEVVDDKRRIVLSISLKSLAEFHMLNSFIPSFLIWIITYATLFFPVDNFNERVMVSITALLVLAALFTQASDLSVITPYFKFLDIWYVTLIIFSFAVVIVNAFIHKVRSKIEERIKLKENSSGVRLDDNFKEETIIDERIRKIMRKNAIARTIIGIFYCLFFIAYGLGALEII